MDFTSYETNTCVISDTRQSEKYFTTAPPVESAQSEEIGAIAIIACVCLNMVILVMDLLNIIRPKQKFSLSRSLLKVKETRLPAKIKTTTRPN